MQHIVQAAKSRNVPALEKLFSPAARNATPELTNELKYFLSVFPSGKAKWVEPDGGCGGSNESDPDHSAWEAVQVCDYTATVGGKKYDVNFEDVTQDTAFPNFVGIYALGVVPSADTGYTAIGAVMPFDQWASTEGLHDFDLSHGVPNSFSGVPGVYRPGLPSSIIHDVGLSPAVEMQHIADSVKHQNAAVLKKLFSPRARQKATDLGVGLKYVLSLFPSGLNAWKLDPPKSVVLRMDSTNDDNGNQEIMLISFYRVSANGKEYDLYFADFTVNEIDPENVGVYALGIGSPTSNPEKAKQPFNLWAHQFNLTHSGSGKIGITGTPGIYIPQK